MAEGAKVEITKIEFVGNHAFSSSILSANMETKPYSKLLSWLTGWGALDQKKLQEDVDRLTAFYYDNGYLNVQIAPPQVVRSGTGDHDRNYDRRGHAVPGRPHQYRGQPEVSAPRTAQAADDEERATVPRLDLAAPGAGAVGFLLEPWLRVRQRRSAHAAGPHHQAGQRGVRDQSGPRSARSTASISAATRRPRTR